MKLIPLILTILLIMTFITFHSNAQVSRCTDYNSVVSNLYNSIETLNVKELKEINGYLKNYCAHKNIETHLLFSELTIADAEKDRNNIELIRNKITRLNILDKSNPHFAWHLYVMAQSWFWDSKTEKAISLLSKYKSYFIGEPKNSIEVRTLSLLGGYFNYAESSIEKEKNLYFDKAEIKANEIGDPELILYVNFRKGDEAYPDVNIDSAVKFQEKKDKWTNMLDSVDSGVTKAEVLLYWGYLEIEDKNKSLSILKEAIQILSDFGVSRTALDGSILYIKLLKDYGEVSEAEFMIHQLMADYDGLIDDHQMKTLYEWLFEFSTSQKRFEDAMKYKNKYYESLLIKEDKSQKKLDELLSEYKVEEQKSARRILEQSLKVTNLEKENEKQKNYILVMFIITLTIAVFFLSLIIYRSQKSKNEFSKLAMIDVLTGAPNRRAITLRATKELAAAQQKCQNLTILLADLDDFKSINDIYGHDVGDLVLKTFADIASENIRALDRFGRWGGEEWLFILPATSLDEAKNLFDRLSSKLSKFEFNGLSNITFSMGAVELFSDPNSDLNSLIKKADDKLYIAKKSGKNRICLNS